MHLDGKNLFFSVEEQHIISAFLHLFNKYPLTVHEYIEEVIKILDKETKEIILLRMRALYDETLKAKK
jgi:hypothetical protein